MKTLTVLTVALPLFAAGCPEPQPPTDGSQSLDAALRDDAHSLFDTRIDAASPDAAMTSVDASGPDAGPTTDCPAFGRWPAPEYVLTLMPNAEGGIYLPDIQASHPEVNWATLDRIYLQAGTYRYVNIGNLPTRAAERPLVITNRGGQVHIGPAPAAGFGYLWVINGGSNWVLTGRYDSIAQTGDAAFPGHRCGAYANSQDTYGIVADDELIDFPNSMNHMGLAIAGATAFELEYLEIRRSTFAGIRIGAATAPLGGPQPPPIEDVHIHDLYVHDVGGEGFYFGSTASGVARARFRRMHVHDVRVLRTANEVAQFQGLGEGSRVHNNVFAYGAMNWRNGFEQDQDNASQFSLRDGPVEIDHNLFIGGRESLASVFAATEAGDVGGTITFHENYFGDTVWLGFYFGLRSALPGIETRYAFLNNVFVNLDPTLDIGYFSAPYYATRTRTTELFRLGGDAVSPVRIAGNRWEGTRNTIYMPASHVTVEDNMGGATLGEVQFETPIVPSGTPGVALEMWTSRAASWAGGGPIRYAVGALVMDGLRMYRCVAATADLGPRPSMDATHWMDLGVPADDVRLTASSPHRGLGLSASR